MSDSDFDESDDAIFQYEHKQESVNEEELALRKQAELLAEQLFAKKCPNLFKYDQNVNKTGKEVVSSAICAKNIENGPFYNCL